MRREPGLQDLLHQIQRKRDHGARMLDQGQGVLQGVRDEQLRGGHREVLLLQLLPLQQSECKLPVCLPSPLSSPTMVTL